MTRFWQDRPTLITGATGLVGSWLTRRLMAAEANVVALVRDWVPNSELVRSGDIDKTTVVRGDIRDYATLERTLGELDRSRRWMLLLGRKSASEKVGSFLLELSDRLGGFACQGASNEPETRFELPFARQQIADVLGLTIETVSRQFTRLKTQGIISLPSRRDVVIHDLDALIAEAG